jgi:hypothetical protein
MVLNANFNNISIISWQSVLLVEESGVRDISEKKVREIAEQLQYYPEEEQIFSTTGCKRVPEKTDYVMEED